MFLAFCCRNYGDLLDGFGVVWVLLGEECVAAGGEVDGTVGTPQQAAALQVVGGHAVMLVA